jgi:rSAM/selenodomain-associated transferase 1
MRVIGVFAKHWSIGMVKTRLAERLGPSAATDFYRLMLEAILCRLRMAPAEGHVIVHWPPSAAVAFAELAPAWQLEPQTAGDLGTRLATFVAGQFARHATKVLVVGSDCPDLSPDLIQRTWELLDEVPIVWGPAVDGGYYLVGLRQPVPQLFEAIGWSTEQVLQQSRQRVVSCGLADALLPPLTDIDDWSSLQAWLARDSETTDPALRELIHHARGLLPIAP